jgi:pimeloyl-ACP methyl ester carboxylesterase
VRLPRRDLLGWLAALSLGSRGAGARTAAPAPSPEPFRRLELSAGSGAASRRAVVLVPEHLDPAGAHPLVVLLHGYAQAQKRERALAAWLREYGLALAYARLRHPPLRRLYRGVRFLSDRRSAELDAELSARPFAGLVVACPVTPVPYFEQRSAPLFDRYADWIVDALLPQVRSAAPVAAEAARTGIGGHSMGAQVALEVVVRHPERLGSVAAVQAAIEPRQARSYARRLAGALSGGAPRLLIGTSTRDPYREANERLARSLAAQGVAVELRVPFGPHTTSWMREIGTLEALLFFDRTLRENQLLRDANSSTTTPAATISAAAPDLGGAGATRAPQP